MAFIFYYRQSKFRFHCDVCGEETESDKFIDTCAKCGIQICPKCNKGQLCPAHFEELVPPFKQRALEIGKEIKKLHRTRNWLQFLPCLVLPFMVIAVLTGIASDYFQVIVLFLVVFSLPSLFTTFDLLFTKSKLNQYLLQIRRMFASDAPLFDFNDTYSQTVNSPTDIPGQHTKNQSFVGKRICSHCKAANPLNVKFCESCGKKL